MLTVTDLSTRFGAYAVTEGLSFTVEPGSTTCLIGESGCGKTVTLLSLLGLSRGTVSGSVALEGRELLGLSPRAWRRVRGREISMIFQEPQSALNPVMTVGRGLCELIAAHRPMGAALLRREAEGLMAAVGLPGPSTLFDRYPHELSGGMRQRVLIAGALAHSPRLVLADEPTSALDMTIRAQIIDLFGRLKRERSCSFLIATHDLALVRRLADRVLVMYAGELVEQGEAAEVLSTPRHPYTRALLAAAREEGPLSLLEGEPPSPAAFPTGCRFHPRCPDSLPACALARPAMEGGSDHMWRCPLKISASAISCPESKS
ncbi:oligopeptide transporter subunit; ATP-binding component of ABC superfamily [uncultured Eubacteriales bacterium]|uniref:Oligopeptide transporter subunit ATP-binding component of ABC superfamily n=1 Tax=uncultured Eubacteriales bacterium TaxID=172733 RepID=A0A212JEF3_9FIRM|nr:oligopeptide transporter subunit; ATP-binding component of ABC superfamily [uncultured Eubacteriales bacterium]